MKNKLLRIASVLILAAITIYLFPHYNHNFAYQFEVGRPWAYNTLTAEFDFPIYKTESRLKEERKQILTELVPVFTYTDNHPTQPVVISLQDMDRLRENEQRRIAIRNGHTTETYSLSEIYTPKTAFLSLGKELTPNLIYDSVTTNMVRENLLSTLSETEGVVQEGEKIIEKGVLVTERDAQVLNSLRIATEQTNNSRRQVYWAVLGDTILVCIFLLLFSLYLRVFRPNLYQDTETIAFFCLLSGIIIAMACLELRYTELSIYLIPIAWVPIIARIFYDSRTALFLHLTTIFVLSVAVSHPFEFLIVQTAVGMVAVASLKDLTRRAQLARTAGAILLTYIVVYSGFKLATTGDWHALATYDYCYFVLNALFILFAYGLIYLFEKIFHLLSSLTLVELTDVNSELLMSFAEKAPGSFQHSMQVSNLCTEAAKVINANTLLVRTGALYHDIGKMTHPEYFTENQHDENNPLLQMKPVEAAKVIISHVSDGEALAQKHHLPEVITHFITSHHGTSLVRYFYNTAVNNGEHPNEQDYRYSGPKPTTKEAAILMMADAVEARSRSLSEFTEENIRLAVTQMIDTQIADGQFADSPLSFHDVALIRETFIHRLIAINHHRIKYPEVNNPTSAPA